MDQLRVQKHPYLCTGSRILSTHWDSGSKRSKMNHSMFLHSDRREYSLQACVKYTGSSVYTNSVLGWIACDKGAEWEEGG